MTYNQNVFSKLQFKI